MENKTNEENLEEQIFRVLAKLEEGNDSEELTEESKDFMMKLLRLAPGCRPIDLVPVIPMDGPPGVFIYPYDYLYKSNNEDEQQV
jgi:hypothetical protein